MKKAFTFVLISIFVLSHLRAQENIKEGWTFGALPAIAYDSDLGFRYGALVNLFYYGDGSTYPHYLHSIYYELSTTTKGSTLSKFYWDTDQLTKNYYLRLTTSFNIIIDRAFDFYGFNGYEANYINAFEDEADPLYRSRMFYRHERIRNNVIIDFQGEISNKTLRWIGGYGFFDYKLNSVNVNKLNEGKDESDQLPTVEEEPGLYELYSDYNILPSNEINGGQFHYFKAGLVYDSRNVEANPTSGMWTEFTFAMVPGALSRDDISFTKLSVVHRQYFPLLPNKLSLVYRLGYQQTIAGHTPFYAQPYIYEAWPNSASAEGIGGAKNVRGILRNRIVGNGIAYGNLELRWKFFQTIVKKQNLYLALAPFLDGGMVTKPIEINKSAVPTQELPLYFTDNRESLHLAWGGGFYTAINENFIIAVMYGRAFDTQDGVDGLYININYLF